MQTIKEMADKYHANEAAKVAAKVQELGINPDDYAVGKQIICNGDYPQWKDNIFTISRGFKVENNILYIGIHNAGVGIAVDVRAFSPYKD